MAYAPYTPNGATSSEFDDDVDLPDDSELTTSGIAAINVSLQEIADRVARVHNGVVEFTPPHVEAIDPALNTTSLSVAATYPISISFSAYGAVQVYLHKTADAAHDVNLTVDATHLVEGGCYRIHVHQKADGSYSALTRVYLSITDGNFTVPDDPADGMQFSNAANTYHFGTFEIRVFRETLTSKLVAVGMHASWGT